MTREENAQFIVDGANSCICALESCEFEREEMAYAFLHALFEVANNDVKWIKKAVEDMAELVESGFGNESH